MRIESKQVIFIREYNSEHEGSLSMIPIGTLLILPTYIQQPKETKIYRCYDKTMKLLGEIRPHGSEDIFEIQF